MSQKNTCFGRGHSLAFARLRGVFLFSKSTKCAISSVVEQCLDMAEVTGSNPVLRTISFRPGASAPGLFFGCARQGALTWGFKSLAG